MRTVRVTVFALSFSLSTGLAAAENDTALFEQAIHASKVGNDAEAIERYEQIATKEHSPNLHFNLGNAYYRTGNFGRAILHFEKALALAPDQPEILANLERARRKARVEPADALPTEPFARVLPLSSWSWLTALSFWASLGGILLIPGTPHWRIGTKLLTATGAMIFVSGLVSLSTWYFIAQRGVVVANEAALRTAPTGSSPIETSAIRPGTTATLLDQYGDYVRIEMTNGTVGWVEAEGFSMIWE